MLKELFPTKSFLNEINCGGCGDAIKDRIYLLTADRAWHTSCLRCTQCSQSLDNNLSCFSKDGNIYCKDDYLRLYSFHKCARCGNGLSSSDLVMRAKNLVFHVNCFSCALCLRQLGPGDTAAIRCDKLLCGEHYDVELLSDSRQIVGYEFLTTSKIRSKKRKTFISNSDESLDDPTERSSTPLRLDLLQNEHTSSSIDFHTYDGSQSPSSNTSSITGRGRTKRMRTSFKHHQLRTMKSYFSINQNPDAKDLKQLAQKTGLSKRVLQVWFQNARAKWRRNVMRQENGQVSSVNSIDVNDSDSSVTTTTTPTNKPNSINPLNTLDGQPVVGSEVHQMNFSVFYE